MPQNAERGRRWPSEHGKVGSGLQAPGSDAERRESVPTRERGNEGSLDPQTGSHLSALGNAQGKRDASTTKSPNGAPQGAQLPNVGRNAAPGCDPVGVDDGLCAMWLPS